MKIKTTKCVTITRIIKPYVYMFIFSQSISRGQYLRINFSASEYTLFSYLNMYTYTDCSTSEQISGCEGRGERGKGLLNSPPTASISTTSFIALFVPRKICIIQWTTVVAIVLSFNSIHMDYYYFKMHINLHIRATIATAARARFEYKAFQTPDIISWGLKYNEPSYRTQRGVD